MPMGLPDDPGMQCDRQAIVDTDGPKVLPYLRTICFASSNASAQSQEPGSDTGQKPEFGRPLDLARSGRTFHLYPLFDCWD